jgi:hypothetical protein
MSRYRVEETDWDDDDQNLENGNRRFSKTETDPPKRSPIRRKHKMRTEGEGKSKAKRNNKKLLHRLKYEREDD